MSQDTLRRFLEAASRDADLRQALVDLAAQHGFALKPTDLTDARLDSAVDGRAQPSSKYVGETEKNLDR